MEKEKVIIVHLNKNDNERVVSSKIDELKELVRSCNGEVIAEVIQNSKEINPSTYIGSGKVKEIKELAENMEADTIIFNNELTGSQMKNLEDIIDKKIVDRTGLILDIFAIRAKTKEGKLQVKLAQLEYRLPRLVGYRNYLSREGAGIGTRGPGEQKLEIDRRTVQREIDSIRIKLKEENKKRSVKRSKRFDSPIPVISLIGYSNAGKSTILNRLVNLYSNQDKKVYSDDLLFATLDVSARKITLDNGYDVIISDTVGFVSNLPTKLVESFKSTLEEIELSELILIVIDSSNEDYEIQLNSTMEVLKDMDLKDKKFLYVFNKIDKNEKVYFDIKDSEKIYISALDDDNIKILAKKIEEIIFSDFVYLDVIIPYSDISKINNVKASDKKDEDEYLENGLKTKILIKSSQKYKYEKYLVNYGI
ncbi:MAG: GTPase HflX [Tissierellia bacterium]|nr:GTPase HflX [Tissierellia bacterium]